jgi:parallel beta-helix repeat protein
MVPSRICGGTHTVKRFTPLALFASLALGLGSWLFVAAPAGAFQGTLNDWQARYGAQSPSGDAAGCQLCHGNANGGSPWNAYGWDILVSLGDSLCDLDLDGTVSNQEAFFCVELFDSDGDSSITDNATEIGPGTQPGWTEGPFNTLFTRATTTSGQLPPLTIGQLDPTGTEPPPPPPPPPPGGDGPPVKLKKKIIVKPGDSIQAALDRIAPYGTIIVRPGVYQELADSTNGLTINKSGVKLIGKAKRSKSKRKRGRSRNRGKKIDRVILRNAGNQRNGIVVVPPAVNDCLSCHQSMEPPFPLHPGVEPGLPDPQPLLYDIEIRGITIDGFVNNGLFTERVDGFTIVDVASVGNKNYGIFPTLSKNGVIARSYASGSDDSGIWVETSENVLVTQNLVEDNVNGFEVSNSDDILLLSNVARNNTVGLAILLLPDIFDDRPGAKRIDMRRNLIHDNNRPNTARPGSILASVPSGTGILHLGVDDSIIEGNQIENNDFTGVAIVDYCLAVAATEFSCPADPSVTPEFVADSFSQGNRVVGNTLVNNGTAPPPHPFDFAAADLTLVSFGGGNCYEGNVFTSFFSILGGNAPSCN